MASRQPFGAPWPLPTSHPSPPASSLKGKRKWVPGDDQLPSFRSRVIARQSVTATVNSNQCPASGNDVVSCFPTANSSVVQNLETRFVWNVGLPQYSQTNLVDVFLFHGDSDEQVLMWPQRSYPFGHLSVTPNDTWWGEKGPLFKPGTNSTQTFYFVLVVSGQSGHSQPSQSTFTATQTNFPNSILASQSASSASASASSASAAASASSASVAAAASSKSASLSLLPSSTASPSGSGPGSLQSTSNSDSFPHWAIALLSVFGFLAFISFLFVFYLLIRNIRRRNNGKRHGGLAHRNSVGSQSPMMANVEPNSPTHIAPGSSIAHGEPQSVESALAPLPDFNARHNVVSSDISTRHNSADFRGNPMGSDGASTLSRADSVGGLFSAVDAAAMAAAFRNVMRKPDFADRPMEEGESPEHEGGEEGLGGKAEVDVLNRELAEEGRDIRSVSSSRGVKVETLSDAGEGIH